MVRALVAGILLVASLGTAGALAWWAQDSTAADDAGAHTVLVVGPEGARLHDGMVSVASATALSLLQATGLSVELATYPGVGSYVRAIDGHAARGGAGWIYETSTGEGWLPGDRSAGERAMASGEALAWRWSDG